MLVSTTTDCGCSASRSGRVASVSRVSSMLTSLPTTKNGTVGRRRCMSRNTWLSTMPLPVPASNIRTAGGRGTMRPSSRPIRAATSAFSLVVITNSRYFSRLSKKRNGSAFEPLSDLVSAVSLSVIATPVQLAEPYRGLAPPAARGFVPGERGSCGFRLTDPPLWAQRSDLLAVAAVRNVGSGRNLSAKAHNERDGGK